MKIKTTKGATHRPAPLPEEERGLFHEAVKGAQPLRAKRRVQHQPKPPPPLPLQTLRDEQAALAESLSDWENPVETGDETSFLRAGLSRQILKKLRRVHWVVQDQLDLHGQNREEARSSLVAFLNTSIKRGLRCVRIIHGKGLGSKNRVPVLKHKVRGWLIKREEILAFCEAPPVDGGSGVLIVLLKGSGLRVEG
ncbi:MAG TPA: Smr/MutS family protein [Burkholderiales bacterium]|nr:Smr/MutS family protein [Burkholderiales bacterium]